MGDYEHEYSLSTDPFMSFPAMSLLGEREQHPYTLGSERIYTSRRPDLYSFLSIETTLVLGTVAGAALALFYTRLVKRNPAETRNLTIVGNCIQSIIGFTLGETALLWDRMRESARSILLFNSKLYKLHAVVLMAAVCAWLGAIVHHELIIRGILSQSSSSDGEKQPETVEVDAKPLMDKYHIRRYKIVVGCCIASAVIALLGGALAVSGLAMWVRTHFLGFIGASFILLTVATMIRLVFEHRAALNGGHQ